MCRARAGVDASIGNAGRTSFRGKHLRVVCSACPHPCHQNLWTSRMRFTGLTRLPVTCSAFKSSRIKHLLISCAGYSQACEQKLWTTSSRVRASEELVQAMRRGCIECNLSGVNDLRPSCSGYSQACEQKLWTRSQARAFRTPSIDESMRPRMHDAHSEPHQ